MCAMVLVGNDKSRTGDVQDQLTCYLVGGAVRDGLLHREVEDRDWVVVGATVGEMRNLNFVQVGRDFPVFLHPSSKEEYALARTERKSGEGHQGFEVFADPEVTLDDDLQRRDLTINAIAQDQAGQYIDPYGGREDIQARVLRHVSPAFQQDPLRVMRVARFAAQLVGFVVAPETQALMSEMVARGELETLSAERVWQEWRKALASPQPGRFLEVLDDCGGLDHWFRELGRWRDISKPTMSGDAMARFVWLELPSEQIDALCQRLKIPNEFRKAAHDWLDSALTLKEWHGQQADVLSRVLVSLRVPHELTRLRRMLNYGAVPEGSDDLLALAAEFSDLRLPEGQVVSGVAYGRALKRYRETWLTEQLAHYRQR